MDLICSSPYCHNPRKDFFCCLPCWLKFVPRRVRHEVFEAWHNLTVEKTLKAKSHLENLKTQCLNIITLTEQRLRGIV
jgi:hypothetical protein